MWGQKGNKNRLCASLFFANKVFIYFLYQTKKFTKDIGFFLLLNTTNEIIADSGKQQ